MFDNLINRHDFGRALQRLRRREVGGLISWLAPSRKRVVSAWTHTQNPPRHWGSIPEVRRRWNRLIGGDPDVDFRSAVARRHLGQRGGLEALSLACGTGSNERGWASTGYFKRIDAVDISPSRIRQAQDQARAGGLERVLRFRVADLLEWTPPPGAYDVVLAEGALHHLRDLPELAIRLRNTLRPGGLLLLNDFVGPTRFQWTRRQLEIVNGALAILPANYRQRWNSKRIKTHFHRPGRLAMRIADPSEAVESGSILDVLHNTFTCEDIRPYGGTILHLLFNDIAYNFLDDSAETRQLLRLCFAIEDFALQSGEIESDFVFAVYRTT